jgi:hypothetical protein
MDNAGTFFVDVNRTSTLIFRGFFGGGKCFKLMNATVPIVFVPIHGIVI